MNDERDVRDWFERSVETLPPEPFAQDLMSKVRRRERKSMLQRYAALLLTVFSCWLLLPALVAPLEALAGLPLVLAEFGGERWPVLVLLFIVLGVGLVRYSRNAGFLRRG